MQFNPYLVFHGRAEEALMLYRSVFGGTVEMMRYAQSPEADRTPSDWRDKIMHGSLAAPVVSIMATDATAERWHDITPGNNFSLSIGTNDEREADTVFAALADGGTVTMPLSNTFWGAKFGRLTDRFGISWMINCQLHPTPEPATPHPNAATRSQSQAERRAM